MYKKLNDLFKHNMGKIQIGDNTKILTDLYTVPVLKNYTFK
jgi:hypothetical protein